MSDSQSEKSRSSKRRGRGCFKWFLIVIGVFIGLFIIVVLLSGSPKENAATDRSAVVEITMESTQERPTSDTVTVSVATANNALSDEPDPTETSELTPAQTESPTATHTPAVEMNPNAATVKDWTQAEDREAIASYWATFWTDAGFGELTPAEMEICITNKVINGCCGYDDQIPLTMMVMVVSGECLDTNSELDSDAHTQTVALLEIGIPAQVIKIIDGDTIDVLIEGQHDTVRYIGMDTPEQGDPGYRAATKANADLVEGQTVYLAPDVTDRDRFDRLLRYVYLEDGTLVNGEMIAQGYAQPVEYEPDTSNAAEFRQLAVKAAEEGQGFWSGEGEKMSYGRTTDSINMRQGADTDFEIIASLPADIPLTIFGRNQDGSWVQVRTPDRSGGWMYAELLVLNLPVMEIRMADDIPILSTTQSENTSRSAIAESTPLPQQVTEQQQTTQPSIDNVTLFIVENNSTLEIIGVRNHSGGDVNISGWWLDGSKGNDSCTIPQNTVLTPGEVFQIATGDSVVSGRGIKCGHKPIWNNSGETIQLHGTAGQSITIESVRR